MTNDECFSPPVSRDNDLMEDRNCVGMGINSEQQPIISVVMSVYNGDRFLVDAIDSILNQTFRDFEFIIVNDGSTDDSLIILKGYANRDCRIRLISRENRGLTISLNEGIATARGEWIARMDADDISLPDRFEKQMEWLNKTGADICGGAVKLIGNRLNRVWNYYRDNDAIRLKLLFGSAFAHPAVILRTCIAKTNLYDENAHYVEDYELWTRLAMLGFRMTNYPGVVLQYRVHSGQITAVRQKQQRVNMIQIFKKYSTSFLDMDLLNNPSYLLIADKQLSVDEDGFHQAVALMNRMVLRYGDPESVVSTIAFIFFVRCGGLGLKIVMRETSGFHIKPIQKLVLLFLLLVKGTPNSWIYQTLYRLR